MEYYELVERMESFGAFFQLQNLDKAYRLVPKQWFLNKFVPSFERFLKDLEVLEWRPEAGDCDDFACWGRSHAKLCQRRLKETESLVIMEFAYTKDDFTDHAVLGVLFEDGELGFLDRVRNSTGGTKCEMVVLSQSEIESCIYWHV